MFTDLKHDIFDFEAFKKARKSHALLKKKRVDDLLFKKTQMVPLRDNFEKQFIQEREEQILDYIHRVQAKVHR